MSTAHPALDTPASTNPTEGGAQMAAANAANAANAARAGADAQQARLALLFRGASRDGRIHPLQHLIQRYWAEKTQALACAAQGSAP